MQAPIPCARQHSDAAWARFLAILAAALAAAVLAICGGLLMLDRRGLLPAAPLTGTGCFNEKFAFLRKVDLQAQTLLAVGSSATWRNLDAALLERRMPGLRAVNAAPCYLHMDQTAYLAEALLPLMPRVDTVLAIVAPRDFESCPPGATAFFDPALTRAYVTRSVPGWLPHVTGFRPLWLLRESWRAWRLRDSRAQRVVEDRHGSSILRREGSYWPEFAIDPRCYEALPRLQAAAKARGARLVIATLPTQPRWAAAFDPDGSRVEAWMRDMAAALRPGAARLVDGRPLAWGDARFADPVHLLYPNHSGYTDFLADAMVAGTGSGG